MMENAEKAIQLSQALKMTVMWAAYGLWNVILKKISLKCYYVLFTLIKLILPLTNPLLQEFSPSRQRIVKQGKEMENLIETHPEFQEIIENIKEIAEHFVLA